MSLLTPPNTGHRAKRVAGASSRARVIWASHNETFAITQSPPRLKGFGVGGSAGRSRPTRSILKKIHRPSVATPAPPAPREDTPEPADALADLCYLERPLALVLADDDAVELRDRVDAYTTLAARLRASLGDRAAADEAPDASWPLFRPLRAHRVELVAALCRDVQRALQDPAGADVGTGPSSNPSASLPSPRASPTKRRHGLTEEQVTLARDLFATSQAALRFLLLAFALPSIYCVFTDEDLSTLLTEVLSIPLAADLPTPNARKTHNAAIWLLQTQRLPEHVLAPASDRIAYALRRGIDGELGKEGKKGSICDGLKAVHDLSMYQPATFVPAFTEVLPSVLASLLAPTLHLRVQACQALGGYAYALSTLPTSNIHARASEMVSEFLTTPSKTARATSASPGSPTKDSLIIRTLRTTLSAHEPASVAQGPVWAMCVLAGMIVMLGPRMYTDSKVQRTLTALLGPMAKHKKSSLRALLCLVWRCLIWAYFQPALPDDETETESDGDDSGEGEPEVDAEEADARARVREHQVQAARAKFWGALQAVTDMGTGAALVAALLGDGDVRANDRAFARAIAVLQGMIKRGGPIAAQAAQVFQHLLSPWALTEDAVEDATEIHVGAGAWESGKLLPRALFSPASGLFNVEYRQLPNAVRPLFEICAGMDDIRWLSGEELATPWVFDGLVAVWKDILLTMHWPRDGNFDSVIRTWRALLAPGIESLQELDDDDAIAHLTVNASRVLVELIQDPTFGHTAPAPADALEDALDDAELPSSMTVKYTLVHGMWQAMRQVVPRAPLAECAPDVFAALFSNSGGLDADADALACWARAAADVLALCDIDDVKAFCAAVRGAEEPDAALRWAADARAVVWRQLAGTWAREAEASLDGAVLLLSTQFTDPHSMDAQTKQAWDKLLTRATDKASEYGQERAALVDDIAAAAPPEVLSPAFIDMLLLSVDMETAREVPERLMRIASDGLVTSYTSDIGTVGPSFWVIRTLTNVIGACPKELLVDLLVVLQDGISTWIADESEYMTEKDYNLDIAFLYQTMLVELQSLRPNLTTLAMVGDVVKAAFCGRCNKPDSLADAFREFWTTCYGSDLPAPADVPRTLRPCLHVLTAERSVAASHTVEPPSPSSIVVPEASDLPSSDVEMDDDDDDDEEPLSFPDSEDEVEEGLFSTPPHSALRDSLAPAFNLTPCPKRTAALFGATPTASSLAATPSTPARGMSSPFPQFPPESSPIAAILDGSSSATTPVTPKRAPSSPTRSGKPRSIRFYDKENASPSTIRSVVDRMIAQPDSPSKLGKRAGPMRDDSEDEDRPPTKRSRLEASPRFNSFGKSAVAALTFYRAAPAGTPSKVGPSSSSSSSSSSKGAMRAVSKLPVEDAQDASDSDESDVDATPTKTARKRKRRVMEAVEVPTLRYFGELQHRKRVRSLDADAPARPATGLLFGGLRRTKSVVLPAQGSAAFVTPVKHRRGSFSDARARTPVQTAGPTPMRALFDMDHIASDDSVMLAHAEDDLAQLPSSDDDLRLGQVTPHRLLSPGMRRLEDDDEPEPGSDDSIPSPSKEVVRRRSLVISEV